MWLEEINLGSYRQVFEENGVNGEYLESLSMFTTEQILRFIRRCHMKWGDFITLCKELRRIKGSIPSPIMLMSFELSNARLTDAHLTGLLKLQDSSHPHIGLSLSFYW